MIKTRINFCYDSSLAEGEIKVFKPYDGSGNEKTVTKKSSVNNIYSISVNETPVILSDSSNSSIRNLFVELKTIFNICSAVNLTFYDDAALIEKIKFFDVLVKFNTPMEGSCKDNLFPTNYIITKTEGPFPKLEKFWPLKDWIVSDLNQ